MPEDKQQCVKVAVRMRPLSKKELDNNESAIVEMEENIKPDGNGNVVINDPEEKEKPATFAFDIVFDTKTEQHIVFDTVGKPALESTLTGYNGTIFAYGQTGSGKSWSMSGGPGELRGIIPRVNEQLFERVAQEMAAISTRRFLVMCSFFEIYNEIIFDLLNPCQDRSKLGAGLQVKEHPVLGIYVKDLQEIVVSDADKLSKLMDSGTKNRAVSSTLMNSVSSRSHSIFTIKVHQKDDEDKSRNVFAKLNLVDLAGSERQKGTGASGQTLKEGANINKSLSALGNVINALVENANGKKVFVPFRNSKLTRVLQESLGGNSLCTMLAALSPAACNYEETLSTLRYANRAKAIKVSATKNEEASQISRLNAEIEELKKKLAEGGSAGGTGGGLMAEEERQEMRQKFQAQLSEMQHMVSSTWEEKSKLSAEHEAQMGKAMEEHKRQQKAMQEECRKRFRLLQDQADLELSIRGLLDSVQALPAEPVPGAAGSATTGGDAPAEGVAEPAAENGTPARKPCDTLLSGELPRQWLKTVASIIEGADALKQQHTMALLFHGAFAEDLRLWVDGEEAHDAGMARTGARRASTKLETLRRECAKLSHLEAEGRQRACDFAAQVAQANGEWQAEGRAATLLRVKTEEATEGGAAGENGEKQESEKQEAGIMTLHELAIEDVGRIMQLIVEQAQARATEFSSLASLEVSTTSALVVRGASLVPGGVAVGPDADLLRSLAAGAEEDETNSAASVARKAQAAGAAPGGGAARTPREERALHEWVPEDADDTPEGAEAALVKLVQLDGLNKKRTPQELLARPPPKFVHDVALLVGQATGFPPSISEDWPESREGKLDVLQQIADAVARALAMESLDFDPADVLKGKEVPKTLRLLQLLAIAAARHKEGGYTDTAETNGKVHRDRRRAGLTKASDLPQVLEAISSCLQRATEQQLQQARGGTADGHASPTRELESSYRSLQERLQEETELRGRLESGIEDLRRQVEESRAALTERSAQLEDARSAAVNVSARKTELRQKVEDLRRGLMQRAQEMDGNPEVAGKRAELEELAAKCGAKTSAKAELASDVKRLQQQAVETETGREKMEMEVKRIKLRIAEGLDGPPTQQSEEILVLQAEKQKWDVKVAALEERMRTIAEADDVERQRETGLTEEKKLKGSKHDDVQMQLQVIIEERDGLREGMDLLWQEKTRADEELENVSQGYTHLSDRLMEKMEESRELEEQLAQYESILSMLQENAEKARHSPAMAATNGFSAPAPPPPPLPPGEAPPRPGKEHKDGDGGSSHYSDDDFEQPDPDEDN